MTVNIRSSALTAQISSHGAELTALRGADGTEYLCPPERRNWDRSAPVLFPNTGAVKNGCTLIGGERYPYIQHGFAKDAEFSVSDQDEGSVSFLLRYSDDTLRLCPYRFELRISYTLTGSTLTVSSGVTNEGPEPIFFSLGFHPGFACPLRPGERAEDYFFSFGGPINADRVILEDALVSGTVPGFWSGETRIPVREGMFDGGSFTMVKPSRKTIRMESARTGKFVELCLGDYPNLVLWAPKNKPITNICIEPWYGLPDSLHGDSRQETKPYVIRLAAQETAKLSFTVTVSQTK